MATADGINVFLTEDTIRWILGGVVLAGLGVAGWVYAMAQRLNKLELGIANMDRDVSQNRRTTREIGNALDRKLEEETSKLRAQLDTMRDRLEEVKEELPSRGFIEGQLSALGQRLDRMMDVKLAR